MEQWASFELLVTLDLRFAGSAGIWQQGDNDVFVIVRAGRPGPYRFRISSGPAPAR